MTDRPTQQTDQTAKELREGPRYGSEQYEAEESRKRLSDPKWSKDDEIEHLIWVAAMLNSEHDITLARLRGEKLANDNGLRAPGEQDVAALMKERDGLAAQLQETSDHLGNLLATIHGDGGHYRKEHGDDKATTDAMDKWYVSLEQAEAAEAKLERLKRGCYEALDKHTGAYMDRNQALRNALTDIEPHAQSGEEGGT